MYEVESATANEIPMFGNVTVGPDGKIQQVQSGVGNIRIPGAGASIQNALPKGQGGMFPDNVAPTGLPIGEAVEFARTQKNIVEIQDKDEWKNTVEEEIADIFIRLCDFCGKHDIDLEYYVNKKIAYNKTREQMHGKEL